MAQIGESPIIGRRRNLNKHKYCSTPEKSASCTDLVLKDRINNFIHPSHSTKVHSKSFNESPKLPSRFKIFSDKENIPFKENNLQIRRRTRKFSDLDVTETKSPAIGRKRRDACTWKVNPFSQSVNNKFNIPSVDNDVQLSKPSSIENEQELNVSSYRRSSRIACKIKPSKIEPEPKKVPESKPEPKKLSTSKPEPNKVSASKSEPKKVPTFKTEPKNFPTSEPEHKVFASKPEPKKLFASKPEHKKDSTSKPEPRKASSSKPEHKKASTSKPDPRKVSSSKTEQKKVSTSKPEPRKVSSSNPEHKKVSTSKPEPKKVSTSKPEPRKVGLSSSKPDSKKVFDSKPQPKKVSDSKDDFKTPVRKSIIPARKMLPSYDTCSRTIKKEENKKAGNCTRSGTSISMGCHPKRRSTRVANKNTTLPTTDLPRNKESLDSGLPQNTSLGNNTPNYSKMESTSGIPSTSNISNKKPPWKKINKFETPLFDFKVKRKSGRLSSIQKKDIYDFPNEENSGDIKKKKVKRKAPFRRKRKALKPSIKPTLLTTDPSFPAILPNLAISSQSFYGNRKKQVCKSPQPLNLNECNDDESHDPMDTMESNYGDVPMDDDGYEASISVSNNTTERGTFSSSHHVGSQTSIPTPDVKARFPGTASTPRHENDNSTLFNPFGANVASSNPPTVLDDLQLCFGFDEPEDKCYIGLSPVKKAPQLSQLHAASIVTHSNVEEIEPIPTRFNLPFPLLPNIKRHDGNHFKNDSEKSSYTKKRILPKKVSEEKLSNEKETLDKRCIDANKSVLFDLELEELQNNEDNEVNVRNNSTRELAPPKIVSPEKSFTQAPRRSYNRESLEAVRQKVQATLAGGYPTTDTDTDIEPEICPPKRPKRKRAIKGQSDGATGEENEKEKISLKTYSKKKKKEKENALPPSLSAHSDIEKRKGKSKETDKSLSDWVSDINSHFSEIEDVALAVE